MINTLLAEGKITSIARGVPRMHILTSALNLLFFLLAIAGYIGNAPGLLGIGIVGGYFANALAVLTGVAVLAWLVVASFTGSAREVLHLHWLAIVNGLVVAVAWAIAFAVG